MQAALYYPYIEIDDPNWLKATLLSFGKVARVAPHGLCPNDNPEIAVFRNMACIKPLSGTMLDVEEPWSYHVYNGMEALLSKLRKYADLLAARFQRKELMGAEPYLIHEGKFRHVLDFLQQHGLCWRMASVADAQGPWYGFHPQLGSALMASLVLTVAEAKGYCVVTNKVNFYDAVLTYEDRALFDELAGISQKNLPAPSQLAGDAVSFALHAQFDFSRLTPDDIRGLLADGKDLRKLTDVAQAKVRELPAILDDRVRTKRIEEIGKEMLDEWKVYRKSLGPRVAATLVEGASLELPSTALTGLAGQLSWQSGFLASAGLLVYKAHQLWSGFRAGESGPYRYLSRIANKGALLVTPPAICGPRS